MECYTADDVRVAVEDDQVLVPQNTHLGSGCRCWVLAHSVNSFEM